MEEFCWQRLNFFQQAWNQLADCSIGLPEITLLYTQICICWGRYFEYKDDSFSFESTDDGSKTVYDV